MPNDYRSAVPASLTKRLLATAAAAGVIGTGVVVGTHSPEPEIAPEILLAMELGNHYEGLRLKPYRDGAGGGIWTVCRGVTGPVVNEAARTGRTFTDAECKQMELRFYVQAERDARRLYRHWDTYNIWVRASMLDMLYNLGAAQVGASTHLKEANAGRLDAACAQMLRWVWGRDARTGQKVRWQGLVNRRSTTAEICAEWGRDGHFSAASDDTDGEAS